MEQGRSAPARAVASTDIEGLDDILVGWIDQKPAVSRRRRARLRQDDARPPVPPGRRPGGGVGAVCHVVGDRGGAAIRCASHGWDLAGVEIRELTPSEAELDPDGTNTMFHPSELELAETTTRILQDVQQIRPSRVVFDSLSELRLLAGNALRYRRQILALKQFFATRECTVMLLDDMTSTDHDLQVQSIAHGVVLLEQLNPEYGSERRRLRVVKYRGVSFRGGYHDYVIRTGGIVVFPRLVAAEHRTLGARAKLASEIPALDALLGGGIEEGTSTLIVGAAGTGKSTLAAQFAAAAAERGQRAALFVFDESPQTLLARCAQLQVDLPSQIEAGRVSIQQIDPAELTPGEFTHAIRHAVETDHVSLVVIDSLNGYLNAMPEERFLTVQLHELLMYLGQRGVATILIGAHQGLIGSQMNTPVEASYLADAVVLLRYFESNGEVRQAISVMKKRGSRHERTHPRVPPRRRPHRCRRDAPWVPRHPDRRPGLRTGPRQSRRRVGRVTTTAASRRCAARARDGPHEQGRPHHPGACSNRSGSASACARPSTSCSPSCDAGAAALLIPEEAIALPSTRGALAACIEQQPPWSDLPVLVLAQAWRAFSHVRRGRAHARERHAARTPGAGHDASERRADGAAGARPPAADSRPAARA